MWRLKVGARGAKVGWAQPQINPHSFQTRKKTLQGIIPLPPSRDFPRSCPVDRHCFISPPHGRPKPASTTSTTASRPPGRSYRHSDRFSSPFSFACVAGVVSFWRRHWHNVCDHHCEIGMEDEFEVEVKRLMEGICTWVLSWVSVSYFCASGWLRWRERDSDGKGNMMMGFWRWLLAKKMKYEDGYDDCMRTKMNVWWCHSCFFIKVVLW